MTAGDFSQGTFVGRVWRPDVQGPAIVVLRGGRLVDITSIDCATMRDLLEKDDPAAFAPLYEALLAAGGSKTYAEALGPFGLDPRQKSFWAQGCARLERLVDEFEALG